MRASLPRASVLLTLVLLSAVLLWSSPGAADDLPEGPTVQGFGHPIWFHNDVWLKGTDDGIPGAKIVVKRDSGERLDCQEGTVHVSQDGNWRCVLSGAILFNPNKDVATSVNVMVYQVSPQQSPGAPDVLLSKPTTVSVPFAASVFSLPVPTLPLNPDDVIEFSGTREDGGLSPVVIEWTLTRDGASVFGAHGPVTRFCHIAEQADKNDFTCYYDEDHPDVQVPPERDEPFTAAHALFAPPTQNVAPAALLDGNYTVTVNELINDVPVDSVSFGFSVGDVSSPPPNGAPGGGGGGDSTEVAAQNAQTIPLAPIPTPGPVIDDSPLPELPEESDTPVAASPIKMVDDDVLRILILAIIAFTVMAMSGARGLGAPRRLVEAPISEAAPRHLAGDSMSTRDASIAVLAGLGAGELEGTDDDAGRARPFGHAWGDRSVTWRFPGWPVADRLSRSIPVGLAPRFPLFARISADGSYLRAALGVLWTLFPAAGLVLGAVAAFAGGAAPLPPALGLVAALLVLAVLDASAGIAAVTAFTVITLARGGLTAEGLELAEGVRGLMGLAALWFVAPLVAAAARPLRRVAEQEHVYPWDRLGDTVIAALVSGWAVQGIVGALGDLTGRELAITSHADALALLTIGAVVARFLLEEAAAALYPRRLRAVQEVDELPPPTRLQQIRALVFRAALLAFFASAFLGSCWQLWLGVAIFSIPQVLQLVEDRLPDVRSLASAVPRGVVQILVLVAIGAAIAYAVDSHGSDDELTAIRQGFVLLAIPGAALELLSVAGGETPKLRWTWPRQLAGAAVVALTAALVLFLL